MNWARRILISLGVAFFAVCCGVVLLFDWSVTGWKAYSVPTGSMRPGMPPGSLVLVHSVPVSSLKIGDVITYTNLQKPGTTITHRIIKSYKIDGKIPAFITKGDANPSPDDPIVGGLVHGKAVWHAQFVGKFLTWGKGFLGLFVLVYIPAAFVTIEEVQRLNDYYRKFRPYTLQVYKPIEFSKSFASKLAASTKLSVVLTALVLLISLPVQALLTSNTVSLVNNQITVARRVNCSGNNTNNVNVTNINIQNSNTGNTTVNGNTNVGNISTGNSSNSNNTTTTIIQTNC